LVVLCPAAVGRRRWGPPPAGVVATAHDIGLAYTAHIVLVHAGVRDGHLQRPKSARRPHAPFWAVHTDLFALRAADNPFEHTRPIPLDPSRTRHGQTDPAPAGQAGEPEVAA
nr:hypothetical protein [Actinomycetota bacterium]